MQSSKQASNHSISRSVDQLIAVASPTTRKNQQMPAKALSRRSTAIGAIDLVAISTSDTAIAISIASYRRRALDN
jgi:hypothetical protein